MRGSAVRKNVVTVFRYFQKIRKRQKRKRAAVEFATALSTLNPGDICIDCGANVGSVTACLLETGCTVHAFEPEPDCFDILRKRFGSLPNLTLINAAVGVENGEVDLFRAQGIKENFKKLSRASSVYASKRNIDSGNSVSVRQIDLIEYIKSIGTPVKILKMDIEGAEIPILSKILSEDQSLPVENIFAELHDNKIPEFSDMGHRIRQKAAFQKKININLDWN